MNASNPDQQPEDEWTLELRWRAQRARRIRLSFAIFLTIYVSTISTAYWLLSTPGLLMAMGFWGIAILLFNAVTGRGGC